MRIIVTQKHIDRGMRNNIISCPISLAISETLNGVYCETWMSYICILSETGRRSIYYTTPEMQKFIQAFDSGKSVSPSEFEVEVKYA